MLSPSDKSIDHVYQYVGERLRFYRKKSGIQRNDLAKMLGVSPQQYYKYEEGQSKCSLTNLYKLAEAFDVPLEAILPLKSADYSDQETPRDASKPSSSPALEDTRVLNTPVPDDAQLVARLVAGFVGLADPGVRHGVVQLVEAMYKGQRQ